MQKLGFPMEKMEIFFKDEHEQLHSFRKNCVLRVKENNPMGVGICVYPDDGAIFDTFDYTPIAFTSIKEYSEFNGKISAIFQEWPQMCCALCETQACNQ